MFIDDVDMYGLVFWYNDAKKVEQDMKPKK